jgi:hypothetical protein
LLETAEDPSVQRWTLMDNTRRGEKESDMECSAKFSHLLVADRAGEIPDEQDEFWVCVGQPLQGGIATSPLVHSLGG